MSNCKNKNLKYHLDLKKGIVLSTAILIAIFTLVYSGYARLSNSGHLLNEDCSKCHLAKEKINKQNAHLLIDFQENLCQGCHQSSTTTSHPSGIHPSIPIPQPFSVDWKGELTCSSCHFIHNKPNKMNKGNKSARQYCLLCHRDEFFEHMKDEGVSLMGLGHLNKRPEPRYAGFDQFSIQCISCHEQQDGMLNIGTSGNNMRHSGNGGSHPIGRKYRDAERHGGYVPMDSVNPLIEFPDGKVGCTSCHQAYTKNHGKLVLEGPGTNLCMECHNL